MRNDTRLPSDTTVRVHGEHGLGTFPFVVVAARSPHKATSGALAAALTAPGAAALFRGFRDNELFDGRDVERVTGFLNEHRGIAALGFGWENAAARCVRLLKGVLA